MTKTCDYIREIFDQQIIENPQFVLKQICNRRIISITLSTPGVCIHQNGSHHLRTKQMQWLTSEHHYLVHLIWEPVLMIVMHRDQAKP